MTKKLWSGRFTKKLNREVELFSESLSFDKRLALYDIAGSIAHVRMLAHSKIIKKNITDSMIKGLKSIKINKSLNIKGAEDIHTFIENELNKKIGSLSGYLHTGRSRNDQVQLDTRLYLKDQVNDITNLLKLLQKSMVTLAFKNKDVIIPGFTHLQHAQPILIAHHLLAYIEMFQRDIDRLIDLYKRIDILPLGSGALAGSNLPLDRKYLAKILGFSKVSDNSIDSVSDRDYLIELLSILSIIGMHLSRLSEELVLWSTKEFNFISINESLCTGSSLMPQKKNPDPAELLRAKSGRLNGNLIAILTTLKGLPLTYNRDLQEDKPPVFDSIDTIKQSLKIAALLIKGTKINKKHLASVLEKNDSFLATDLADYLVSKNVPFRKAHEDVGKLVAYCENRDIKFRNLTLSGFRKFNKNFSSDILKQLNAKTSVRNKKTIGSTNPKMVLNNIKKWQRIR